MLFTKGQTRVVFLTENFAIKIALPLVGPLNLCLIIARNIWKGEVLRKFRKHRGQITRIAKVVATNCGIEANRREIRISREHPEYPIAPVLRHYLWGFVVVMPRGKAFEGSRTPWESAWALPSHLQDSDLFVPENTCRFPDGLRIVDYGSPLADDVLPLLFGR